MNKKSIAVIVFSFVLLFSYHLTQASFFGNLFSTIFGSQQSNLGASAATPVAVPAIQGSTPMVAANPPACASSGSITMSLSGNYPGSYSMSANGSSGITQLLLPQNLSTQPVTFLISNVWFNNEYRTPCSVKVNSLALTLSGHSDGTDLPINISNVRVYQEDSTGKLTQVGSVPGNIVLNYDASTHDYSSTSQIKLTSTNSTIGTVSDGGNDYEQLVVKGNINLTSNTTANFSFNSKIKPSISFVTAPGSVNVVPAIGNGAPLRFDNN